MSDTDEYQVNMLIQALLYQPHAQQMYDVDPDFHAAIHTMAHALPEFVEIMAQQGEDRVRQLRLAIEIGKIQPLPEIWRFFEDDGGNKP